MGLLQELNQKKVKVKTPVQLLAEEFSVSEAYVRLILNNKRDGSKHTDAVGDKIRERAKELIND